MAVKRNIVLVTSIVAGALLLGAGGYYYIFYVRNSKRSTKDIQITGSSEWVPMMKESPIFSDSVYDSYGTQLFYDESGYDQFGYDKNGYDKYGLDEFGNEE